MARGPLLAGRYSHTKLRMGSLPDRPGIWLYELEGNIYRALAKVQDAACASRVMDMRRRHLVELDLEEGVNSDTGQEDAPEFPRRTSSLLNGLV